MSPGEPDEIASERKLVIEARSATRLVLGPPEAASFPFIVHLKRLKWRGQKCQLKRSRRPGNGKRSQLLVPLALDLQRELGQPRRMDQRLDE